MTLLDALELLGLPMPRTKTLKCPAHEDKTPSLRLYPHTDSWYCFSCTANGDAYGLVAHFTDLPIAVVLARHGELPASSLKTRSHADIEQIIDRKLWSMGDALQLELRGASTDRQAVMWWDRWAELVELILDRDAPGYEQEQQCVRLERELAKMVEEIRQLKVLKDRKEYDDQELQRPELRSEVPDDGRHGGGDLSGSDTVGEVDHLRVESTPVDDATDGGVCQAHTRLLHRDWVACGGYGSGQRRADQVEGVQIQVTFRVEQEAKDCPLCVEQPPLRMGDL